MTIDVDITEVNLSVSVTPPGTGGVPQDLSVGASPSFYGISLSSLSPGQVLVVGLGGVLEGLVLGSGLAIDNGALIATGGEGADGGSGTVTSVGLSMPLGFSVSSSPIIGAGTLSVTFANGYGLPTLAKQQEWDDALSLALAAAPASALASKADLVGGKLSTSQLPDLTIVDYLGAVASEAAMLALQGQRGDWCLRTDAPAAGHWILSDDNPALLASWVQIPLPAVPVSSVNGQTGAIVLSPADLSAATAAQGALADTALQPGDLEDQLVVNLSGNKIDPTAENGIETYTFQWPAQILASALSADTAASGSAFEVNARLNASSIYSVRPQIAVGSTTGSSGTLAITTAAEGDVLRFDISQAGGGCRLAKLYLTVRRTAA